MGSRHNSQLKETNFTITCNNAKCRQAQLILLYVNVKTIFIVNSLLIHNLFMCFMLIKTCVFHLNMRDIGR